MHSPLISTGVGIRRWCFNPHPVSVICQPPATTRAASKSVRHGWFYLDMNLRRLSSLHRSPYDRLGDWRKETYPGSSDCRTDCQSVPRGIRTCPSPDERGLCPECLMGRRFPGVCRPAPLRAAARRRPLAESSTPSHTASRPSRAGSRSDAPAAVVASLALLEGQLAVIAVTPFGSLIVKIFVIKELRLTNEICQAAARSAIAVKRRQTPSKYINAR